MMMIDDDDDDVVVAFVELRTWDSNARRRRQQRGRLSIFSKGISTRPAHLTQNDHFDTMGNSMFISVGMVVTGSINTISTKLADNTLAVGRDGGDAA